MNIIFDFFLIEILTGLYGHGIPYIVLAQRLIANQPDFRYQPFFGNGEGQDFALGFLGDTCADIQKKTHLVDRFDIIRNIHIVDGFADFAFDFLRDGGRSDLAIARNVNPRDFFQQSHAAQYFLFQIVRQHHWTL